MPENQAWSRVFRIGQQRDVEVARFVVKFTAEEEIIAMQEREKAEVDAAMNGKNRPKLSTRELLRLFGEMIWAGDGGKGDDDAFVFVDDPY
jgi:SNF2 family DNA or RNA helicase